LWLLCHISFASGECFAQRRLPTRAELLGDFGLRHEKVKSMIGTTHDQEFGCHSSMDEQPPLLDVFFDKQVESTDTGYYVSQQAVVYPFSFQYLSGALKIGLPSRSDPRMVT
jgi:hypothetical protein